MRLAVASARIMCPFSFCCRSMAGLLRPRVGARCSRLHWQSGRIFHEGFASGSSIREIARGLQRAVSTVSREVARHGGRRVSSQ